MPEPFLVTSPPPDLLSRAGIGALAVLVAGAWVAMCARGAPSRIFKLGAFAALVMAASAAAAWSGTLTRFDRIPPPMGILIVMVLLVPAIGGLSSFGRRAAVEIPLALIVELQIFRLPLELVMHHAANVGVMPQELSFSGYNFDIVTGIGAAVIGAMLARGVEVPRSLLWIWNAWGIYCLTAIAVIAIATSPMVRAFGDDPRHVNTWVLYFPYVWLPAVMVSVAIFSHVLVTRALLSPRRG